jgi:hypothetical protein
MKFYGLKNKNTGNVLNVELEVETEITDWGCSVETTIDFNFEVEATDETLPWLVTNKAVVLDVLNNGNNFNRDFDLSYPYFGSLKVEDYEIAEFDI